MMYNIGPLTVPRVWVGLWQLSSPAWGTAPASKIRAEMTRHMQHGFTTFGELDLRPDSISLIRSLHPIRYGQSINISLCDLTLTLGAFRDIIASKLFRVSRPVFVRAALFADVWFPTADHYGSAEMLFGQFRKAYITSSPGVSPPVGCTKWCIFKTPSVPITRAFVEDAVRERITRMKGDGLDMLQIHWQDYNDPGYLQVLGHLIDIKRERTQRLDAIGLVNFDSEHLSEICSKFDLGDIVSNQVQVRVYTAGRCMEDLIIFGSSLLWIQGRWPIWRKYAETMALKYSHTACSCVIITYLTIS